MCSNVLYVDDVTAYVIGWQKELTDMAKEFLQETMHITEAEWYAALVCYSMLPVINIRENFGMASRKVRVC